MAIRKIFNGINILKPGYYGDPFDVHPDTIYQSIETQTHDEATILTNALWAYLSILDVPFKCKILCNPEEAYLRVYLNPKMRISRKGTR